MAFTSQIGASIEDRCKIMTATPASAGPEPVSSYALGSEIRCTYVYAKSRETDDGSHMTPTEPEIWLEEGYTATSKDRVRLTQRNGAVVSEDYAIIKEPRTTGSQVILYVRLIKGNSVT